MTIASDELNRGGVVLDFKVTTPEQKIQQPEAAKRGPGRTYDLIIVGAGPAGFSAAIYATRAGLDTKMLTGPSPGGQLASTSHIDNFPGFPQGIEGAELAQRFRRQAERFGAGVTQDAVTEVDFSKWPLLVRAGRQADEGRTVIIATGAAPRRLGVPGEEAFFGRGVSTCATCDGFFYRDKQVVVVGGGDSAIDEGLFLTKFAREVVVVHRRHELRATSIYQERAFANPKMTFVWDSVVEEIEGDQTVSGVRIRNVKTGETSVIAADGVFVYIGMIPQTELLDSQVALDENGYVVTDDRQRTDVPGVFAAGDVQNPRFRQVVVAAGEGAKAAMEAECFLVTECPAVAEREGGSYERDDVGW
jgi:thioredoxin reductase (NADPH)